MSGVISTDVATVDVAAIRAACCVHSAIDGEKQRRIGFLDNELSVADWIDDAPEGFSYNWARDGHPKQTEYWCLVCCGWYGVPHHGPVWSRTFAESQEMRKPLIDGSSMAVRIPIVDGGLLHESADGNRGSGCCAPSVWRHPQHCACLRCEVVEAWQASR